MCRVQYLKVWSVWPWDVLVGCMNASTERRESARRPFVFKLRRRSGAPSTVTAHFPYIHRATSTASQFTKSACVDQKALQILIDGIQNDRTSNESMSTLTFCASTRFSGSLHLYNAPTTTTLLLSFEGLLHLVHATHLYQAGLPATHVANIGPVPDRWDIHILQQTTYPNQ